MPRKTYKQLGTLTKQAEEFVDERIDIDSDELRLLAERAQERLQAAGEIDVLQDQMDEHAPEWTSLVGVTIELNWRYWIRNEQGKRKGQLIWAEGTIVEVAPPQASQIPKAIRDKLEDKPKYRAVKIRWPEDKEFDEKEKYQWSILKPEDWNGETHMCWRYAPCELAKLRAMHSGRK